MHPRLPRNSLLVSLALTSVLAASAGAQSPHYEVQLVAGSCAAPGALVTALAEQTADGDPGGAPAEMDAMAAALGTTISRAYSALPTSLPDLAATEHAVRVLESLDSLEHLVACGEFGGIDGGVRDMQLGLASADDSGLSGVVWLRDNGDGTTSASVAITAQTEPTVPVDADAEVEVRIEKSLYVPNPLEVKAGTTVTWVNEDALPHTTTSTTGAFDSGYMALDGRYSYTFDTPGEYPIFCIFHPRMRAVVIVK